MNKSNGHDVANRERLIETDDFVVASTKTRPAEESLHDDLLGELTVDKAQSLSVRFNRSNLINSVTNTLFAEVVGELVAGNEVSDSAMEGQASDTVENVVRSVLLSHEICSATTGSFFMTQLVNRVYAGDLRRALSASATTAGQSEVRRICQRWQDGELLNREVNKTGESILRSFSHLPLASQCVFVESLNAELNAVIDRLNQRLQVTAERRRQIEQQNTRRSASQTVAASSAQNGRNGGRLENNLRRIPYVGSRVAEMFYSNSNAPSPRTVPDAANAGQLLLRLELEIAAIQTEIRFYNEIVQGLSEEVRVLRSSVAFAQQKTPDFLRESAKAENKRDFGLMGGELFLNGSELTAATINYLTFAGKESLLGQMRQSVSPIIGELNNELEDSDFTRMYEAAFEIVAIKLSGYNITDAIAAMMNYQPTFQKQLLEVFRVTAAAKFLASGYQQFLDVDYFASFSYPPSVFSETNKSFQDLLANVSNVAGMNIAAEPSFDEPEVLCFYVEYFCVPLKAFEFYREQKTEFERIKNSFVFNPHLLESS